jgi:hypothetical protein
MSNHQGTYDIFALLGHLPFQFRWLAKKELFSIPPLPMPVTPWAPPAAPRRIKPPTQMPAAARSSRITAPIYNQVVDFIQASVLSMEYTFVRGKCSMLIYIRQLISCLCLVSREEAKNRKIKKTRSHQVR